jgi:uncharacterized protein YbjT (DUF2867 family)
MAICGTPVVCGLDRRAHSVMTAANKAVSGASMSVSSVDEKRLVIVGATGMVGGYAIRYALDNPAVKSVTSIGRKRLGILHSKLKEVLHQNFADCSALTDTLSGQDAAVLLSGDVHRFGVRRGASHHNRRLYDRIRASFP